MALPELKRRPFLATICALFGTLFALFSALPFWVSLKNQTTLAFLDSLLIGTMLLAGGIFLCWRSWLNFAGTADRHAIDFTSPFGRAIAISIVAAKGLGIFRGRHSMDGYVILYWIGIVVCTIAPIVVWWRTRNRSAHEAEKP